MSTDQIRDLINRTNDQYIHNNPTNSDFEQRFINGLKDHNIDYELFKTQTWRYVGDDSPEGKDLLYETYGYKSELSESILNNRKDKCICGQPIQNNYFIAFKYFNPNEDYILYIGKDCAKKFVCLNKKRCEICDTPHRNRSVNRCNDCRGKKFCIVCNDSIDSDSKYDICNDCSEGFCKNCKKKCNPKYELCWNCLPKCINCGKKMSNTKYKICFDCNKKKKSS